MQDNNIVIRSEEVQEILEATPNSIIRWGNIVVLSLILILFFISWFVKYPDTINASVIVTTQEPPQKEYTRTTGKIAAILVGDDTNVSSGDYLAVLENTANYKDVLLLKSIIDTITVNNVSFSFPFEESPILFLGNIESDYALFENNYLQYQLNKEYQPLDNDINANNITKAELFSRLRILQSQKKLNQLELNTQKKELERNKNLFSKGVIAKQAYEQAEILYSQAQRNFANIDVSISSLRESIANVDKVSKANSINKTREDISLLKSVIQSFNQLKRAIKDWELQYVLKSNIRGKVSFANAWTVSQTVNQGDLIFTIIPKDNSAYIAYLKSPAQNSGKLKEGQRVNIKLQNYPSTEFGTLEGHVKSIALLPDEKGEYMVSVTLPEKLITSYKKEILFKYEMQGSADIITEDIRLIERFFGQLKNIIN